MNHYEQAPAPAPAPADIPAPFAPGVLLPSAHHEQTSAQLPQIGAAPNALLQRPSRVSIKFWENPSLANILPLNLSPEDERIFNKHKRRFEKKKAAAERRAAATPEAIAEAAASQELARRRAAEVAAQVDQDPDAAPRAAIATFMSARDSDKQCYNWYNK
jgi:hypothetical protein